VFNADETDFDTNSTEFDCPPETDKAAGRVLADQVEEWASVDPVADQD
jgi:hypothetical protein